MPTAALLAEVKPNMPSGSKAPLPPNEDADNPLYKEDNFRMWCLKVLPCSKRYCHDWTTCPWAHAQEKAKRRDPRVYNYTGVACPEMKKSMQCPRGDQCPYAHNVFEYWLHHSRYRTQLCNDGVGCKRKICFFAHTLEELRVSNVKVQVPPDFRGEINSTAVNPFANTPSSSARSGGNRGRGADMGAGNSAGAGGADLQQLQALARLQGMLPDALPGATAPQGMGADNLGFEQLVQLMMLQQQQALGGAQMSADPMQNLMAQMLLGQQQQQQMAQMQQQMAALQLLNQMQGLGAFPPQSDPYGGMSPMPQPDYGMARQHSGLSAHNGGYSNPGYPGMQAQQADSASVDELARQLSGLSASGGMQSPVMQGPFDAPSSARSLASASTPLRPATHHRLMRQHTHDGVSASAPIGVGLKRGGGQELGVAGMSARSTLLPHTSPVSVSALGDGYTTATANSYFSEGHSLGSSSHEGSELDIPVR